jgi:hypothetical protein
MAKTIQGFCMFLFQMSLVTTIILIYYQLKYKGFVTIYVTRCNTNASQGQLQSFSLKH